MRASDLDWRSIMNGWSRADISYLRSICDEKIQQMDRQPIKRKILIVARAEG
jgi:hypothetical protein